MAGSFDVAVVMRMQRRMLQVFEEEQPAPSEAMSAITSVLMQVIGVVGTQTSVRREDMVVTLRDVAAKLEALALVEPALWEQLMIEQQDALMREAKAHVTIENAHLLRGGKP